MLLTKFNTVLVSVSNLTFLRLIEFKHVVASVLVAQSNFIFYYIVFENKSCIINKCACQQLLFKFDYCSNVESFSSYSSYISASAVYFSSNLYSCIVPSAALVLAADVNLSFAL